MLRVAARPRPRPRGSGSRCAVPRRAAATATASVGGVPPALDKSQAAKDALRKYRLLPDWDHLRDLTKLKGSLGKTIKLPDLSLMPKQLGPDSLANYLLTQQRCRLAALGSLSRTHQV